MTGNWSGKHHPTRLDSRSFGQAQDRFRGNDPSQRNAGASNFNRSLGKLGMTGDWWGKPHPDMERPLSNVIFLFLFHHFYLTLNSVGCFDNESV